MKRANRRGKPVSEADKMDIMLSSLDQDNFDDAMPRSLLEEFIREQGGDPEALWKRIGPWIDERLAARAKRNAR
jgi:hypothetical protein